MKFTKMHGIGNDYVYVNCFKETVEDPEKTAIFVSDRHFGIGSDGLPAAAGHRTGAVVYRRTYSITKDRRAKKGTPVSI